MYMFRRIIVAALLVAVAVPFGFSSESAGSQTAKMPYQLGDSIDPFTLKDIYGKEHNLAKVLGKKILVLDFLSCQCPISNIKGFEKQRMAIVDQFKKKDVLYIGIDSNVSNNTETIKAYAKKHNLNYVILKDWNNKIADKFGAKVTPEVFVIGKDRRIQYHGTISDNKDASKASKNYLADALTALISGDSVKVKTSKAFGCSIKRAD